MCVYMQGIKPLLIVSRPEKRQRYEGREFRPQQFEYHPSISYLMVIGSLDGEVVVVNHESEKMVCQMEQ